jgi:hypothetical protein
MRTTRIIDRVALAALMGLIGACSDSNGPGDTTKPPGDLTVLRLAEESPPLYNAADSFYAMRGEDRELRILFQDGVGGPGEEYLRLRVDAPSLLALPDGTPVQVGDSVLIHVRVVDPARLLFEFEPAGLLFNATTPALLKIHYNHADHDFNGDGSIDQIDGSIEDSLAIWRQEQPGDPFVKVGTALIKDLEEVDAGLPGFSRYALAY